MEKVTLYKVVLEAGFWQRLKGLFTGVKSSDVMVETIQPSEGTPTSEVDSCSNKGCGFNTEDKCSANGTHCFGYIKPKISVFDKDFSISDPKEARKLLDALENPQTVTFTKRDLEADNKKGIELLRKRLEGKYENK